MQLFVLHVSAVHKTEATPSGLGYQNASGW